MTDLGAPSRRRTPTDIMESRRATAAIRPFVTRFEEWNHRAAKATAGALSHLSTEPERQEYASTLAKLHQEVHQAYEEFEAAVSGTPRHGRIEDLRAAFLRLLTILGRWGTH